MIESLLLWLDLQPKYTMNMLAPKSDAMMVSPAIPIVAEALVEATCVSRPVLGTLMESSSVGMRLFNMGMMLSGM